MIGAVALGVGGVGPAWSQGSPGGTQGAAVTVRTLPFTQVREYPWPLTASHDQSERVVSTLCNNGRALYAPTWVKYTAAKAVTVLARATDNNDPYDRIDEVIRNTWGVAVVAGDGRRVVACMKDDVEAQTLPVSLTAGQSIYVVRFATSTYGSVPHPDAPTVQGNLLLTFTTGTRPVNDDLAAATVINVVPYEDRVDTLLATEEPTDLAQIGCHSSGSPNNTAWWSYTPRRSGHLEIAGTDYVLAKDTAAGPEVVYDPGDCTGSLARPHVSAGTRYLIEALTPQPGFLDVFGPVLVPGGPITVRVSQQVGPSAPTGVTATTDRDARTATLRWSDPAFDGDSPITGYRVRRNGDDTGGTGPWGTTVAPTVHALTFRYLLPGATYRLSVRALNADGPGPSVARVVTIAAPETSADRP